MTNSGQDGTRGPAHRFPNMPKYYLLGLIVMLVGLVLTIYRYTLYGLVFIIIGFGLGIVGRIFRKVPQPNRNAPNPVERAEEPFAKPSVNEATRGPAVMIRCTHCGTLFDETSIKCPNCGAGHS